MRGVPRFDVVVLGAGPAGTAAAIECRARGLDVLIVEAYPGRESPGETLHPGVETVFQQLGVWDALKAQDLLRPTGISVEWDAESRMQRYGGPLQSPWRGLQIGRRALNGILRDRAERAGVVMWDGCRPLKLFRNDKRLCGIETTRAVVSARWIVDATGRTEWITRHLQLQRWLCSVPLVATYGYADAAAFSEENPVIRGDPDGWTWQARISPTTVAWVRTTRAGAHPDKNWHPPSLRASIVHQKPRFVNATWHLLARPAGQRYFVIGDAAARLCPARSSGILHGMLSGIVAACCIHAVDSARASQEQMAHAFTEYVHQSFREDARSLSRMYEVFDWWRPGGGHAEWWRRI